MKTSKIDKITSSNSHSSNPFFNKSGERSFSSQAKETESTFINSNRAHIIQKKNGGPSGSKTSKKPKLTKNTLTGIGGGMGDCGVFLWYIHWGLSGATNRKNGWIIQKVELSNKLFDCKGKKIDPEKTNGLKPSWYPVWEAWKVRNGVIYAGNSNIPVKKIGHSDRFGQKKIGDKTKGETVIKGTAEFYENLTLPSSFKVTNKPPADKLPSTNKAPKLSGGTGSIPHHIKATWNCCGKANKRSKTQII